MSLLEVNKITPQSGTTLVLGDSGDTINFGSGVLPNFENLTVTGDLTVDTNSLKVDSTNNRVGIGTASPSVALDVVGAITATGNITGTLATAAQPNITSLGTLSSATISGDLTVDTNTLFVDSTNNRVGIGTTTPEALFHIQGSTTGQMMFRSSNSGVNKWLIGKNSSADFSIGEDGNEWLYVERDSGNVGIGTTSPENLLHVYSSSPKIIIQDGGTHGTNSAPRLEFKDGSSIQGFVDFADDGTMRVNQLKAYPLTFRTNNVERVRITSSGNVGIGTTSPEQLLHVSSTTTNALIRVSSADGSIAGIDFGDVSDTDAGRIRYNSNDSFSIFTNTAEAMRINSSGNVGIGTTSPATNLDVNGSILASATAANSFIEVGRGSGGVAMTINDSGGNANLTFNHRNRVPDQNGNAARISVNTDDASGGHFEFEIASGVTSGVIPTTRTAMEIHENGMRLTSTTSIRSMNVVELNSVSTGTSAGSYTTYTVQGIDIYASTHTFSYGFTALSSSDISLSVHQINSNQGGHTSKIQYDFSSLSTTGGTLVVSDIAASTSVNFRILVVEYV